MKKIGFIGCGNMGGAIASAVSESSEKFALYLADHSLEKADALSKEIGARVCDNDGIAASCDCIFLGVKPQVMHNVLSGIAPVLKNRKDPFFLVSMAAGVSIDSILKTLGQVCPIIRIMPNTPVSVGEGMVLYTAHDSVTCEMRTLFLSVMEKAGVIDELPEKLIDAGCAVSGCGPAFVCLFMEAMSDAGVACGLPRDKALLYAKQTLLGTAKLAVETNRHPAVLKDAVCSPGGSTIMGVQALEDGAFRAAVMAAVSAAYERTCELGK